VLRLRISSTLAVLLAFASPARAQEAPPGPAAEAVAREAFLALEERRWDDVATFMHPTALRAFRNHEIESARTMESIERTPYVDPEMPEAVARWHAERTRAYAATHGTILERRFRVRTAAELEALTAEELFTRWLRANDPMDEIRRAVEAGDLKIPADSIAAIRVPKQVRSVIGSVVQDDSTVLVAYLAGIQMDTVRDMERPALLMVRHTPAGWRLWSSERDSPFMDHSTLSFGISDPEDLEERLNEAQGHVVSWPAGAVPAGRAFVTGYPGGVRPPRALVVEVQDGSPTRVEIPAGVFGELMEKLLMPWLGLEEESAAELPQAR